MELSLIYGLQHNCCKIAITLIDPCCWRNRLITSTMRSTTTPGRILRTGSVARDLGTRVSESADTPLEESSAAFAESCTRVCWEKL
jgi:hypothetical protein